MSYSRWGNGSWYVFWDASQSGDTLESQHLACWYSIDDADTNSWSYERVHDLLSKHSDFIIRIIQSRYDCSPDEAAELQEYMQEWCWDVKQKYTLL
jgi:hypothetical protein